jgi:TatD DNase family protein
MMIDTHCHIDLFDTPLDIARTLEAALDTCIAVTMLPMHFELAQKHLTGFRRINAALGLHPLRAREGRQQFRRFTKLASSTEFFGEIGIDGSSEGHSTMELQTELFQGAILAIPKGAFVSVHSRSACREVLQILKTSNKRPVCFHYFTGGELAAKEVAREGHYFSINHRMLDTRSPHRALIAALPKERILAETDGPFLGSDNLVSHLEKVYRFCAQAWQCSVSEVETQLARNYRECRTVS